MCPSARNSSLCASVLITFSAELSITAPLFSDALQEYYDRNLQLAVSALRNLLTINPTDLTAMLLLNRIEGFVRSGVPDGWTGVEQMRSK